MNEQVNVSQCWASLQVKVKNKTPAKVDVSSSHAQLTGAGQAEGWPFARAAFFSSERD